MLKRLTTVFLIVLFFTARVGFCGEGEEVIYSSDVKVLPEVTTKIELSSTDVNRIMCEEPIQDVVFSQEKGITVKVEGKNAFVKFLVKTDPITGKPQYTTTPSEFYIVCGGAVYTMIAVPKKIPARTVRLVMPQKKKIRENVEFFRSLSFEKRIVYIVRHILKNDIPDSWDVKKPYKKMGIFKNVKIFLTRIFRIEGTGLRGKEYLLVSDSNREMHIKETQFLLPELTENPVGICLSKLVLRKGQPVRLIFIEKVNED